MATPAKKPEDDPRVALDLALKLRRGQIALKDIPAPLHAKIRAVPERELVRRAIETSIPKRYHQDNRPPAPRIRR